MWVLGRQARQKQLSKVLASLVSRSKGFPLYGGWKPQRCSNPRTSQLRAQTSLLKVAVVSFGDLVGSLDSGKGLDSSITFPNSVTKEEPRFKHKNL